MTANASPTARATDSFLRFALRLDAVASGAVGAVGLLLAPRLAEWSGTSPAFEYAVSAFFVAYGLTVFGLSARRSVRRIGTVVAVGNVAFTAAAAVLVLSDVMPLTTVGIVLTLASGVFTLVMAELQYVGVRRSG